MGYTLGVDLGTTFSAAAVERDGIARVVELGAQRAAVPSVIHIGTDHEVMIGEAAEHMALTEPHRVLRHFKRLAGDPNPQYVGTTPYPVSKSMSLVLSWVLERVTELEGGPPDHVVLTHPAAWRDQQIGQIEQAAQLAELTAGRFSLETEPVAAAFHYAQNRPIEEGAVVVVYDLGGGTFDVTVLRRTADSFDILGEPVGLDRLGGIDFDDALRRIVIGHLGADGSILETPDPENVRLVQRLLADVRRSKEHLSDHVVAQLSVGLPGGDVDVTVTREEFEQAIRPLVADTTAAVRQAVGSAAVWPGDLAAVLLVGGSSRIPFVAEALTAELGVPILTDAHPKHVTALGAAEVARQRIGGGDDGPLPRPLWKDPRVLGGAIGVVAVVLVLWWLLGRPDDSGPSTDSVAGGTQTTDDVTSTTGVSSTAPLSSATTTVQAVAPTVEFERAADIDLPFGSWTPLYHGSAGRLFSPGGGGLVPLTVGEGGAVEVGSAIAMEGGAETPAEGLGLGTTTSHRIIVPNRGADTVTEIDPVTLEIMDVFPLGELPGNGPIGPVYAGRFTWVHFDRGYAMIDRESGSVARQEWVAGLWLVGDRQGGRAAGEPAVASDTVWAVDLASGTFREYGERAGGFVGADATSTRVCRLGRGCQEEVVTAAAETEGSRIGVPVVRGDEIWVADLDAGRVLRVDSASWTETVVYESPTGLEGSVLSLYVDDERLLIAHTQSEAATRVVLLEFDPTVEGAAEAIELPSQGGVAPSLLQGFAVDGRYAWLVARNDNQGAPGSLFQIDLVDASLANSFTGLGARVDSPIIADGHVWVSAQASSVLHRFSPTG